MAYTLDDLEQEAKQKAENVKKKLRERYKLARDLGFSASEAQLLSSRPEQIIRQLAKEKSSRA
jgi:hypothetical protein